VDRSKSGAFDAYDPQWNFGFGLSYAKVDYSNFSINKNTLNSKDSIIVTVTLTNKSNLETKEVVQVYLTDHTASVVPAGKKLIAFDKVLLGPKDQKTVSFTIKEKLLNFVDSKGNFISEPGKFTLSIASDKKEFILVK
jgi:beta-glucosidase